MSQESPRNVAVRIAVLAHEAGGMGEEENLLRALLAKAQMTLKETDCEMYPRYFAGWLFSLVLVDRFTGDEKETIRVDSDVYKLLPPEGDVVEVGPPLRPHRVTRGITTPSPSDPSGLLDHPDYVPFTFTGRPQPRFDPLRDLGRNLDDARKSGLCVHHVQEEKRLPEQQPLPEKQRDALHMFQVLRKLALPGFRGGGMLPACASYSASSWVRLPGDSTYGVEGTRTPSCSTRTTPSS